MFLDKDLITRIRRLAAEVGETTEEGRATLVKLANTLSSSTRVAQNFPLPDMPQQPAMPVDPLGGAPPAPQPEQQPTGQEDPGRYDISRQPSPEFYDVVIQRIQGASYEDALTKVRAAVDFLRDSHDCPQADAGQITSSRDRIKDGQKVK